MTNIITKDNFKTDVLEASKEKPVIVDFYADWCGPCKMQLPIMDELANEIGDKAIVAKVNTERDRDISAAYGVMSIPTLIVFKGGKEVDRASGVQSKEVLNQVIEAHM